MKVTRQTLEKFAILWLVLSSGAVFYSKLNMYICVGIMLLIVLLFISLGVSQKILKTNIKMLLFLTIFGFLTCVVNAFYGFSVNDFIIFFSRLLFLCVICSTVEKKHFMQYYIDIMYYMAIVSLVCFVIVGIFPNISMPFSMNIEEVNWQGTFYYTLGFYNDITFRNAGVFTEGGVYQLFLNMALYFAMHVLDDESNKRKIKVFIVTILTTVSSVGYISLALIMLSVLLKREDRKKRYYILIFVAIFAILCIDGMTGVLSEKILRQGGSFGSRYDDMIISILVSKDYPMFGIGVANDYISIWEQYINSPLRMTNPTYIELQRSNGLGIVMMRMGIPFTMFYVYMFYRHIKKLLNLKTSICILGAFVITLGALNEPIALTTFFLMFLFIWKNDRFQGVEGEKKNEEVVRHCSCV